MVETITETSQLAAGEPAPTKRPNHILRSSRFKYYIHDGIDACRFQLIGELSEADVAELQGCWRTAKTTLRNRKLILDLRGLNRVDDAGKKWLVSMAAEGAESVSATTLAEHSGNRSRFRKLGAIFRSLRVPSADSSTQAQ
jgi:ABC-type transporter Mla MlaB component